jgi:ABC-2 type transport system ATP-binding protein
MGALQGAVPVRVAEVSKTFQRTVALDGVSFDVQAGEIFGLLGPNGAGKTTLIRTILDIIKPDRGSVAIFGRPFQPSDRDRIGYMPEERGLYPRQPVGAVLEYLGCLKGMSRSDARAQAARWLERFELGDAAAKKVEQLSKGNQQKVQIAATLMARPSILVLDEPLSGLDPLSARLVNAVVRECAASGQTIILSTHQMGLVEALCTRVFMIARGRSVLSGELREIKRRYSGNAIRVCSTANYQACPFVAGVTAVAADGDGTAEVQLKEPATAEEFLRWLVAGGARVEHFERVTTPLEEIFVQVAGRAAAETV